MQHKKIFLFLIIFFFLAVPSLEIQAQSVYGQNPVFKNFTSRHLTEQEIQRVKAVKQLLHGIDSKSLQQTIDDLGKTHYPQVNLEIREAMAKTYADLVKEYNVVGQKKKDWLYSMVCLNMAYIQFGGGQGNSANSTSLNRLIYRKLKEYLPLHALKQHGLLYSLE